MKKMIRAAYTRLWGGFRTRTRIALTNDIRQWHAPRRSKRKKIRLVEMPSESFFSKFRAVYPKNQKAASRFLDLGCLKKVCHVENGQIARCANASASLRTTQGYIVVPVHFLTNYGILFVAQVEIRTDTHTPEALWGFGSLDQPGHQSYQHQSDYKPYPHRQDQGKQ
jgi:hypothetical protein